MSLSVCACVCAFLCIYINVYLVGSHWNCLNDYIDPDVGTHKKRLTKELLMNTHNICFLGEMRIAVLFR